MSPCSNGNGQIFPQSLPKVILPPQAVKADGGQDSDEEGKDVDIGANLRITAGHAGERPAVLFASRAISAPWFRR